MTEKKIEIDLGEVKLIAELDMRNMPECAPGICVFLQDKKTGSYQDICTVCPDMSGREFAYDKTPERIECLVWGNEHDECYTETFNIPVYHDSDGDEEE